MKAIIHFTCFIALLLTVGCGGNDAANARAEVDPELEPCQKLVVQVRDELIQRLEASTEELVANSRNSRESAATNAMAASGDFRLPLSESKKKELEKFADRAEKATRASIKELIEAIKSATDESKTPSFLAAINAKPDGTEIEHKSLIHEQIMAATDKEMTRLERAWQR